MSVALYVYFPVPHNGAKECKNTRILFLIPYNTAHSIILKDTAQNYMPPAPFGLATGWGWAEGCYEELRFLARGWAEKC